MLLVLDCDERTAVTLRFYKWAGLMTVFLQILARSIGVHAGGTLGNRATCACASLRIEYISTLRILWCHGLHVAYQLLDFPPLAYFLDVLLNVNLFILICE